MKPRLEIYLIRHGQTEWNAAGRFQGQLDSPLTARGVAQGEAIARRMAPFASSIDAFFASPLGRTRQTSDIIRAQTPYPPVRLDDHLREVSFGAWDGLTHIDIDAGWPGLLDGASSFDWFFRAPDGESYEDASARGRDWLEDQDGIVVAVSHGLLSRIIRGIWLDLPREQALQLPVPQDVIWHLRPGRIDGLTAE